MLQKGLRANGKFIGIVTSAKKDVLCTFIFINACDLGTLVKHPLIRVGIIHGARFHSEIKLSFTL